MNPQQVSEFISQYRRVNKEYNDAQNKKKKLEEHAQDSIQRAIKEAGIGYRFSIFLSNSGEGGENWAPTVRVGSNPYGVVFHKHAYFLYAGGGRFM
jgi:acyl CoA:acetate/3-ketoacid CoA transferase alpha subunit